MKPKKFQEANVNGRIMGKPSNLQPTVATHFYNYKQVGFIHTARRNPTDR